jgi:1-acyl-sn-glycerol-3-phosphate acyltransferase
MIKAAHSKLARLIFIPYMNRLLKKHFSNFFVVNDFPDVPENAGLIITPNHISWWDGFLAEYAFSKFTQRKIHLMMLEEQLKKYWFFKKVGAYSINPNNSKSIIETAAYTKSIVENSLNYIVLYPQGEIEPFEQKPLKIKNGLKYFISGIKNENSILPAAFKIQYYNDKNPAVILRFGELINSNDILKDFEKYKNTFVENVDKLSEAANKKSFKRDLFRQK